MRLYLACASALQNPLKLLAQEVSREMKRTKAEMGRSFDVSIALVFLSIVRMNGIPPVSMATCPMKGYSCL